MIERSNLKCPKCEAVLSQVDVATEFDCPHCGAALTTSGFVPLGVLEFAGLLFFGALLVVAVAYESVLLGVAVVAAWIAADVWVRSQVLDVRAK